VLGAVPYTTHERIENVPGKIEFPTPTT